MRMLNLKIKLLAAIFFVAIQFLYAKNEYTLDFATDFTLTVSAAAINGIGTFFYSDMHTHNELKNQHTLLPWDKKFAGRYSKTADNISDIGKIFAIAPFTIGAYAWFNKDSNKREFATFSLMFLQAIAIGNGINLAVRSTELWPRPYMYATSGNGLKQAEKAKAEAYGSFFSGHATVAFTVATFSDEWFKSAYPNSCYKGIVTASAYSLAAFESALRVAAGKHYPSDVIAGAIVGTGVSLMVLQLHKKQNYSIYALPGVIGVTFKF